MIPVSAPPRVHQRLRAAPDGPVRVLHRGPHAAYVDVGGWCVGVTARSAARVPCGLRTLLPALPPVDAAHVEGGVLHLDGVPLRVGRYVDVRVPRLVRPGGAAHAVGAAAGLTVDEVAALVGAGDGLTPYGDDVLCGWLATHRAAGTPTPEVDAAVRALASRTTVLSATLLDCALEGEVLPELADWLRTVGTVAAPGRAAALVAVGHSSGRGLLAGARRALGELRGAGVAA